MIIKPELFQNDSVRSLQSTRLGGISEKPYDSMNLGVFGHDKFTQKNVDLLAKSNGLPHSPCFLNQIHSNQVVEYFEQPKYHGQQNADACFTKKKNVICAVLSADCLPVLIADKKGTTVAAVHCGWRGLYAEILGKTIQKLGVSPDDLQCWLGPSISYKPYRVEVDFRKKFVQKDAQLAHCFYQNKKGGWHADLKKIAVYQLERLGVHEITQTPYCTSENNQLFYSYRRDQETGRMASMIWLE